TEPFSLAAKNVTITEASITAPETIAEYSIVITIDPTDVNANPGSLTTNLTFSVFSGGPFFDLTIESFPTTAVQSNSYNMSAKLRNIGNETANSVFINWTLPTGWSNTSGNLSQNISTLAVNSVAWNNITVSVAGATATAGSQAISVSATGTGLSGNATDNASKTVTVSCSGTDGVCGSGCSSSTDSDCPVPQPTPSGGGGPSSGNIGSAGVSFSKTILGKEILNTSKTVKLVRGESNTFPVEVTNVFKEGTLYNVTLNMEGFLEQYLSVSPVVIAKIDPNRTEAFTVTVKSPAYMEQGRRELLFTITGRLVGVKVEELPGGVKVTSYLEKELVEKRLVNLIIREISEEKANEHFEAAKAAVDLAINEGLPSAKMQGLLEEAAAALEDEDYRKVRQLSQQIAEMKKKALAVNDLISDVRKMIAKAESNGLTVAETRKLLNLAIAAFEREDFETAAKRAKDAQLSLIIETKGKVNYALFLRNYWPSILGILVILSTFTYLVRQRLVLILIARRLEDLEKEAVTIQQLMAESQAKTFQDKSMSTTEYHKVMYQYETRLTEIREMEARLRARRVGIIRIAEEISNVRRENVAVVESIKRAQEGYFIKGTITKKKYQLLMEEYRLRRSEIEKAIAVLEARMAKKEILKDLEEVKGTAKEKKLTTLSIKPKSSGPSAVEPSPAQSRKLVLGKLKKQFSLDDVLPKGRGSLGRRESRAAKDDSRALEEYGFKVKVHAHVHNQTVPKEQNSRQHILKKLKEVYHHG
ncbi:MAG: hypothetical protein AABX69_02825, partial [Nanoarchaeota archaeon]